MLKTVGRIRLVSELATDPWTTTRSATAEDGAPVIVRLGKVPVRFKPGDEDDQRFGREADQTQGLEGEHIVPVLDRGVSFAIPWIVHPYLPGYPLAALVEEHAGPLAPDLVAQIGVDVAAALEAAHGCDPPLLHQGISLDTLWLHADDTTVCVTGFALSRVCLDAARAIPPARDAARAFASPEQVGGGVLGPGTDVFSLAATLLTLATGERLDAARCAGDAGPLERLPTGLREPLIRALAADPAARGTAAELGADLRALVDADTRGALAARFGLEPGRVTERPPAPEGAPATGLPLDSVTREQLLPEAFASYRSYHPTPAHGPADVSTDDDLGDALDWDALLGVGTDLDGTDERRDTTETALPDDVAALYVPDDVFEQMPTYIGVDPQLRASGGSGEAPLESTLELPLPAAHERITDAPALPASSFGLEPTAPLGPMAPPEPIAPPEPVATPLQRLARVEVQGWPLSWLLGLGLLAVMLVVLVAVVTAALAS